MQVAELGGSSGGPGGGAAADERGRYGAELQWAQQVEVGAGSYCPFGIVLNRPFALVFYH